MESWKECAEDQVLWMAQFTAQKSAKIKLGECIHRRQPEYDLSLYDDENVAWFWQYVQ